VTSGKVPQTLHTKDEAAAILRCKTSWLEKQAAARRIPFTMVGGTYKFTDEHIAEIIRINEFKPSPTEPKGDPTPARASRRRGRVEPPANAARPLRARPRSMPGRRSA
jgi:excisionase family DNA binding protein